MQWPWFSRVCIIEHIQRKACESFWNILIFEVTSSVVLMQFLLLNISAASSTLFCSKKKKEKEKKVTRGHGCVCACACAWIYVRVFLLHVSPDTCTLSGCEEQTEARATVTGLRPVGCEMNHRANTLSHCCTHSTRCVGVCCVACMRACERQEHKRRARTLKEREEGEVETRNSYTVVLAALIGPQLIKSV